MKQSYHPEIEQAMKKYYATLSEKDDVATQPWRP